MEHDGKAINEVFDNLNEQRQEEILKDPASSLLFDIDAQDIREREPEFEDPEKHWVRRDGWLEIAKKILAAKQKAQRDKNARLSYLTLPGYYRLDVSLLLANNLIGIRETEPDGSPRVIDVVGFETEPTKYGRMQVQTPKFRLFGATSIESVLVDPGNDYYLELRDCFPFDIVNLDLTTSLTPHHEGPYSKTLEAINTIFQLQSGHGKVWALYLTFRNLPYDWEAGAQTQLFDNLQGNLDTHPSVLEEFQKTHKQNTVGELKVADIENCISQSVTKWLTDRAHLFGFRAEFKKVYQYTRYKEGIPPYPIYKQTMIFSPGSQNSAKIPMKGVVQQPWMNQDLIDCVARHKPVDVAATLLKLSEHKDIFGILEKEIEDLKNLVNIS